MFSCHRLRASGLLPLCHLVEPTRGGGLRFTVDRALLSALVDRWRPETHTFHLPVGEMAVTLQDVSLLLGLPLVDRAVGARAVDPDWRQVIILRFDGVIPRLRTSRLRSALLTTMDRQRLGCCSSRRSTLLRTRRTGGLGGT